MKIFVFDLDFTLWNAGGTWCDATHPPYKWEQGKLYDSQRNRIRLYNDVVPILQKLKKQNKIIVAASRTFQPTWAQNLLDLFEIDVFFDLKEIYPSSKIQHFEKIQHYFHLSYSDMVFFDDEFRNIQEVAKLGVKTVWVENGIKADLVFPFI